MKQIYLKIQKLLTNIHFAENLMSKMQAYIQGGPKKVSQIIFAITLSTVIQFS